MIIGIIAMIVLVALAIYSIHAHIHRNDGCIEERKTDWINSPYLLYAFLCLAGAASWAFLIF